MIEVDGLGKSFGERKAVDGVSFRVGEGTCFGLIGPNGAGKTTTIRMLVGALASDCGTIHLGQGMRPGSLEARHLVGLAPQSLAIYEELSAAENLIFLCRLYGIGGADLRERVDQVLELVGLGKRRQDRVVTFSGGMKRRLNLACGVVHRPSLLFLDEPTVGVDPQSRNWIFDNIETLKKDGVTVLYTTHYMEEAERLCDQVAIMDQGRIIAQGTVPELVAEHGGDSVMDVEFDGGESFRRETGNPLEDLAGLVQEGKRLQRLKVEQPGLEKVFLNLTGRSLRDV